MGRPSGKVPTAPGGRLSWAPSAFLKGRPGALTVLLGTNPCKSLLKEPQPRVSRGHRQATVESLPPADPPAEKGVPCRLQTLLRRRGSQPLFGMGAYMPPPPVTPTQTHTNTYPHVHFQAVKTGGSLTTRAP